MSANEKIDFLMAAAEAGKSSIDEFDKKLEKYYEKKKVAESTPPPRTRSGSLTTKSKIPQPSLMWAKSSESIISRRVDVTSMDFKYPKNTLSTTLPKGMYHRGNSVEATTTKRPSLTTTLENPIKERTR